MLLPRVRSWHFNRFLYEMLLCFSQKLIKSSLCQSFYPNLLAAAKVPWWRQMHFACSSIQLTMLFHVCKRLSDCLIKSLMLSMYDQRFPKGWNRLSVADIKNNSRHKVLLIVGKFNSFSQKKGHIYHVTNTLTITNQTCAFSPTANKDEFVILKYFKTWQTHLFIQVLGKHVQIHQMCNNGNGWVGNSACKYIKVNALAINYNQ